MNLFTALVLILCGILAAANFIIQKQPDSRQYIDKLTPYQGWIGLIALIDGLWILLATILNGADGASVLGRILIGGVAAVLGFLMGYGLIIQYTMKDNAEVVARAQRIRDKLAALQIPLGLAAIVVGGWGLLGDLFGR